MRILSKLKWENLKQFGDDEELVVKAEEGK